MERGAQPLGPPGKAPALSAAGALPEDRQQPVIRPDEVTAIDLGHDGVAAAADAGIDDGEEYGVRRIFGGKRGEEVRRRLDAEGGRIVERVDDGRARRARREDCPYLADVEIGRAEIGEENEWPGAAQAAAFFSLFFSDFFSDFFSALFSAFFSDFCSSPAAAVCSVRSVSVTSASGALSPLRKPIFRMRV